ncbi:MAG TPA: right-handed parallel beta-helix repeat-containing protein [Vicinamibacterales bacterium]|nr:right-handed parallel beta-helix repeat-containing protein [Vicinamibacterales bacterium]
MRSIRVAVPMSVVLVLSCLASVAHAQATRTWVSGVGDDANPCSRTAPCKTFAGAISKTAASGEIDTLDPGGFGAVTITKSIVLDGTSGLGGVLVSGTNAIVVNAGSGDVVILRNLDINGLGTGVNGVFVLGAGDVRVENCKIYGFAQGIFDNRANGHLAVKDSVISNNQQTGVIVYAPGSGSLAVSLDGVQMHSNGNAGFAITSGARAVVSNSSATSNTHGFYADSNAVLNIDHSVAFGNASTGINSQSGATIRLYDTTVSNNGAGLSTMAGNIFSYGMNRIAGNVSGNGPTSGTIPVQ